MIGTSIGQYEILDQLGQGGMGIVYRARDTQLDRVVALKFLPGHMSQDEDSKRRFVQEAKAASALDHANICTIHHIGETDDGAVYIVMSYYDGQTLKYMMGEKRFAEDEALNVVRQIASGLARAHAAGIVHRDIKPANIMVTSHGEVKILDFGIAKLGSSSDLTKQGSTLGTVAYMSPEQAQGAQVGPTADLWSLGVVLYEMLTGRRPFDATYDQALLYAILNEAPTDISEIAPDITPETVQVLEGLLKKKAPERIQSAAELLSALGVATGTVFTGSGVVPERVTVASEKSTLKVMMWFALGGIAGLAAIYTAMIVFGLPDWVFPLGVLLLLAGTPITFYATHLEKLRAGMDTRQRDGLRGFSSWLTLRKAAMGGVFALAVLGLVAAVFMGMRAMGIGPAATLITSGQMNADDVIVVADFEDRTSAGNMGSPIAEAIRVDLRQSNVVSVMDVAAVREAMGRMELPDETELTPVVARQVAVREGAKAALIGDISSLGSSFVLSLKLVDAGNGAELVNLRETAKTDGDIVDAVDRLSASLREGIGESLISIRNSEPLSRVTTASMEALRLFTLAEKAKNRDDADTGITYALQAVAIDSSFASAYRILAALENNRHGAPSKMIEYARKAYEHIDRLPPDERNGAIDGYYNWVERSIVARVPHLLARLEEDPTDGRATNTLSLYYRYTGDEEKALEYSHRVIELDPRRTLGYINSWYAYTRTQEWDMAEVMLDSILSIEPDFAGMSWMRASQFAERTGNYRAALDSFKIALGKYTDSGEGYFLANYVASTLMMLGRHAEAEKAMEESVRIAREMDNAEGILWDQMFYVSYRFFADGDLDEANRRMAAAFELVDPASLDTLSREYTSRSYALAALGRNDEARAVLEEQARYVPSNWLIEDDAKDLAEGMIALNERRYDEAVDKIARTRANMNTVPRWLEYELGTALVAAGRLEDAAAVLESAARGTGWAGLLYDFGTSTLAYRSLGEVYDRLGRTDDAILAYQGFVDRWADADPHLQPQVRDVRKRIDELVAQQITDK